VARGDVVFIPQEAELPVILRPFHTAIARSAKGVVFENMINHSIGTCYVHGIMDGEGILGMEPDLFRVRIV
jgi:hypothetical protein